MKDKSIAFKLMRKLISHLANLTPNVVYYPRGWPAKINGVTRAVAAVKGEEHSEMTTAAIAMSCAMHENLKVGDEAKIELTGVTRGEQEVGDFIVTVKRAA